MPSFCEIIRATPKNMTLNRIIIVLFFAMSSVWAHAQPDERGLKKGADTAIQKGSTYAIIVGISDYKVVPDLQYADKDAQAFESFLLSEAGGKIPTTNIETFLNENATRTNVGDAISILARKAKSGDRIYFFFAGHGDMEDLTQIENGLLLLHNSPNGNYFGMNDDVLEILDLKRYLSPLAQKGIEMIFIVDACHSGNLKGGVEGVQQTASALASSWGKEYKILSCQPNQLSLESAEWGGGRGLFSLQLEEGIKGLADMDNNGVINMFELQSYIQTNVARYSEGKQIPLISGDLSKPIATVNPVVLAALKKQKAENYPLLAVANTKGSEEKYVDSLDEPGKKLYASFRENLTAKKLIWPIDTNALRDYKLFIWKYAENPLTPVMRRNLAAALNDRFNGIVGPLLKGQTSYSSRDECYYAMMELDSCMNLLGDQHYMFTNLKARKLFMEAMSMTWALSETEYNIGYKPTVLKAISLLEQSATLEPNAAYTLSALGVSYNFVYEFDKANAAFQKYLDLRPNDYYAKYTLGSLYINLKQYAKAEAIFESMIKEYPEITDLKIQLSNVYMEAEKPKEAMVVIEQMVHSEKDRPTGYFFKGLYHSRQNNLDSAIYYYNLTRDAFDGTCRICDNNIGHAFFVHNMFDSAKRYFRMILDADSTEPFANFNLATVQLLEDSVQEAMSGFIRTVQYAPTFTEGFVTNLPLYFEKKYTATDKREIETFKLRSHTFNMQYLAYLSIFYAYMRTPGMITNTENINFLLDLLFNYKQHEALTWYHQACYKSMIKDNASAIQCLEKALKLGYGSYFTLKYDADLEHIRSTPEFKSLIKKYFPAEK